MNKYQKTRLTRFGAEIEIWNPAAKGDRLEGRLPGGYGLRRWLKGLLAMAAAGVACVTVHAGQKEGMPFDRLGAEAQKHLGAQGSGIVAVKDGGVAGFGGRGDGGGPLDGFEGGGG
jgi:hypothetical protein